MGGITTGVGVFSGIDTASLIDQLIAASSRPQLLAQQRLLQLQTQQAAYLDINSKLGAFKSAAAAFRLNKVFDTKLASTSDDSVLTATASTSAINGNYKFIVDRLVTTQQLLSRGFSDQDSTAVGLDSLTLESSKARLDRDTALADLNNGEGVNRGTIVLNGTEVDLSRVATVGEVLDAINNSGTGVSATVSNGAFVLDGVTTLSNKAGSDVLSSLGLDGTVSATMTGSTVYGLGTNTALSALNDGRGVTTRTTSGEGVSDFTISVGGGTAIGVRVGEIQKSIDGTLKTVAGAASTVGQVINRINDALAEAGETTVTASIDEANGRIVINDTLGRTISIADVTTSGASSTATDLGIATSSPATGTVTGGRILAGLNTTLVSSLNGGQGLSGTDGLLDFTTGNGTVFQVNVSGATTVDELLAAINANGAVTATFNPTGNGLQIKDNTTGGSLVISGTNGTDAAAALGISGTFTDGIAKGDNLQLAYFGRATLLADLNNGDGVGTGTFEIVDANSNTVKITINENHKTLGDIVKAINDSDAAVNARINDNGDGIVIEDTTGQASGAKIRISDTSGSVATKLRIAGEASGSGTDNFIDGSFETTIEFDPTATLKDIVTAINNADPGVRATIINDGAGANPYRLSLVSDQSGLDGRFIIDSGDFDLGFRTLEEGQNARIFYGSSDPANGVLISSSSNTISGVIDGVTIDLKNTSEDPVNLAITTDTTSIESKIATLVSTFNSVIERIDYQSRYDEDTEARGPLLGDGTALALRDRMFSALRANNDGFSDTFNRLAQVGLAVGDGGKLVFDSAKFRDAYAQDPEAVKELFTRRDIKPKEDDPDGDGIVVNNPDAVTEFEALGVIPQLEELANNYVTSIGGVLQNRSNALNDQIAQQQSRIEYLQASLDRKRDTLQKQFLAMEQAIGAFQTQGSALSQISLIG